jgi:hypothetical protein
MKSMHALVLGLFMVAWVTPALADCPANGRMYATGAVVGDYECQPDGKWKRVERR